MTSTVKRTLAVVSNLPYIVLGFHLMLGVFTPLSILTGAGFLLMGIGSSFYHAFALKENPNSVLSMRQADIIGIMAGMSGLAAWSLYTLLPILPEVYFVVAGFVGWIGTAFALHKFKVPSFTLIGALSVPVVIAILIADWAIALGSLLCFAFSLYIWSLDRGPSSFEHAGWHVFTAVGFYLAVLTLI